MAQCVSSFLHTPLVLSDTSAVPCASAQSMSPLEEDEIDGGINGNSKVMVATESVTTENFTSK